jgi:arylsulfatase A-like enzyme
MKRLCFVMLLSTLLSACTWTGFGSPDVVEKVILISIDDLRADFLGAYNPSMKTSSNVDRFALESVLCTNAASQASSTAMSHKSILYSLYPNVHKTSLHSVPEEKVQSPIEVLRSNGFKTAAFVGGGQLGRKVGFDKGFDVYWEQRRQPAGEWKKSIGVWLKENHKQKFFLFIHTYEVHCPFYPPPEYVKKYAGWYKGDVDPVSNCGNDYYNHRKMTPEDYRFIRDLYAASVNYVDDYLGELFSLLKTLGIYDKTMIVFFSDHGESLGERGYVGHNQLYQVQLHIPLIFRIPGIRATRIDSPVESVDVMPTVFDVLKLKSPFPFQGRSLIPVLRGKEQIEKNRLQIAESGVRNRVRKGNISCIFSGAPGEADELYDISKDPEEIHNLASENPGLVAELKNSYGKMFAEGQPLAQKFVLGHSRKPRLDEETKEQLKALGYVAD